MFQTKVVEKIKNTHFVLNNPPPRENHALEKYCSTGQATGDNMAHAPCILDK